MHKIDFEDTMDSVVGSDTSALTILWTIVSLVGVAVLAVIGMNDTGGFDTSSGPIFCSQEWIMIGAAIFVITEILYIVFNFVAKKNYYGDPDGLTCGAIIGLKLTALFCSLGVLLVLAVLVPVLIYLFVHGKVIIITVGAVAALFGTNALVTKAIYYKKPKKEDKK